MEEENRRPKQIVGGHTTDIRALKDLLPGRCEVCVCRSFGLRYGHYQK
jgi:hypothetical protein